MNEQDLTALRREYSADSLRRADLKDDPFLQFGLWMSQAQKAEERDPTAMILATYNETLGAGARIVLLKHFNQQGFCWYTDFDSQKGQQLADNPRAELLFYWPLLERQVRINGTVSQLTRADALQYFNERPEGSRFSAAASDQSTVIGSREELEAKVASLQAKYPEGDVPCPANWGGYCLSPERIEFWQGRASRLHDRFQFYKEADRWAVNRLSP